MAAAYTLSEAQTELTRWKEALQRLSFGSSYTISTNAGSRTLTRASLPEVRDQITYFERIVAQRTVEAAGGSRGSAALARFS